MVNFLTGCSPFVHTPKFNHRTDQTSLRNGALTWSTTQFKKELCTALYLTVDYLWKFPFQNNYDERGWQHYSCLGNFYVFIRPSKVTKVKIGSFLSTALSKTCLGFYIAFCTKFITIFAPSVSWVQFVFGYFMQHGFSWQIWDDWT